MRRRARVSWTFFRALLRFNHHLPPFRTSILAPPPPAKENATAEEYKVLGPLAPVAAAINNVSHACTFGT